MDINYIVFDLDRTLLNDDRKISQNSIDILNLLRKEKKLIIYNTARGYGETLDVLRQFPADYLVLAGGSLILDSKYKKVFDASMPSVFCNDLLKFFKKHSIKFVIQTFINSYSNFKFLTRGPFKQVDYSYYINEAVYKIDVYFDYDETLDKLLLKEISKYDFELTPYSRPGCYRITYKNLSKLSGLKKLDQLNLIDLSKTISFGDDVNDLGMLLASKVGVLTQNNHANYNDDDLKICGSNNEDGPCLFLKDLFKL